MVLLCGAGDRLIFCIVSLILVSYLLVPHGSGGKGRGMSLSRISREMELESEMASLLDYKER
jgi:hypothetical protein